MSETIQELPPRAIWLFFLLRIRRSLVRSVGALLGMFIFAVSIFLVAQNGEAEVIFTYISSSLNGISVMFAFSTLLAILLGYVLFIYGWAGIYVSRFRYQLTNISLNIEYGIIKKSYSTIPYDKIQDVNTRRNVIERVLGLSSLLIPTASSSGLMPGALLGLSTDDAEKIKQTLINKKLTNNMKTKEAKQLHDKKFVGELKDIIGKATLEPTAFWIFLFGNMWFIILLIIGIPMVIIGLYGLFGGSLSVAALFIVPVVALFALIAMWTKLVHRNYRYEITLYNIKKESGVINKAYTTIPYDRIQNVDIHRNLLERILGLSTLFIQTAGGIGVVKVVSVGLSNAEGVIPGLSKATAEKLREHLMSALSSQRKMGQGL